MASVENVIAVAVGVLVFGEKVGAGNMLGILLVLCSIAVMNLEIPTVGKRRLGAHLRTHGHAAV